MEWAMTVQGERIHANTAVKGIPYFCLNCGSDVIFARGEKYRPYFRHLNAKNHHEVLQCENYCSRFGMIIDDYVKMNESELQTRSQVRLELCKIDKEWKLYLRFPVIKPEFHAVIDREQLYFKVKCEEEEQEFSSLRLLGFDDAYKMPVSIRDTYTITVSNPSLEEQLQLKISGIYKPFQRKTLLFKFLQGCLLHIPYQNVMLNGRFFLLTKIPLSFPSELIQNQMHKLEDYLLYDLQMPEKMSRNLRDWFSRILKINLLTATCHLDLLEPNSFRLLHGLVEVTNDSATILLTCNGSKPDVNWIMIIDPYGRRQVIQRNEQIFQVSLPNLGLYVVYLLNQRGEMFEIRRVPNIVHETCNPLVVAVNGKQRLFSETTFSDRRIRLTSNCPVTIYSLEGKPCSLKPTEDLELDGVTRVHVPYVWSIKRQMPTCNELPIMLKLLESRSKFKEVYVGMPRFHRLCQLISSTSYPQKSRLLLLLNMRRGFVPSSILPILQRMEEST